MDRIGILYAKPVDIMNLSNVSLYMPSPPKGFPASISGNFKVKIREFEAKNKGIPDCNFLLHIVNFGEATLED
jgi:hypothetical protein